MDARPDWLFVILSQLHEQIPDNCHVHQQQNYPRNGDALLDFVELEWDQRTRDYYREVFGPSLFQPESNPFGQQQRGIEERTEAYLFELAIVHQPQFGDQSVNESIVGIDSDGRYPICSEFGNVFVKQFDRAYAKGYEEQSLSELEDCDEPQALTVGLVV